MSINVRIVGIEEAEHPFYIVRYIVEEEGNELINSVARYAILPKGKTVQFLEPDMRKMLTTKAEPPIQPIVDQLVRETVEDYLNKNEG